MKERDLQAGINSLDRAFPQGWRTHHPQTDLITIALAGGARILADALFPPRNGERWLPVILPNEGVVITTSHSQKQAEDQLEYWTRALRCRPCVCGHDRFDHSQILTGEPCLDCQCSFFCTPYRPNPSRSDGYG